jgi:hypothetical protein
MNQAIEVVIKNEHTIAFIDHGGYESRNESTTKLFQKAFGKVNMQALNRKHFYINTDDVSFKIDNTLTFGYTTTKNVIPCPDFTFDCWTECGIEDYELTTQKILARGKRKYKQDKLFWIGNIDTQPLRRVLYERGKEFCDKMEIISMEWHKTNPRGQMHSYSQYVSLEDHANYKYLIDCGARGYSGRLKFLLHTGRPLFLVARNKNKKEFFHDSLIPYEHFIPVKKDLTNLVSQIEWADKNTTKAFEIAENAKNFAINNLNKPKVIEYLASQLQKI